MTFKVIKIKKNIPFIYKKNVFDDEYKVIKEHIYKDLKNKMIILNYPIILLIKLYKF